VPCLIRNKAWLGGVYVGMRSLSLFIVLLGMVAAAQVVPPPATKVHKYFLEDAHDTPANNTSGKEPSAEDLKAYAERGAARRSAVRTLITNGELTTGEDLAEAAQIFQHGESAADYLLAHVLATDAATKGNDQAKWLAAATLDRYLQLIGQPQIFGTQYPLDPNRPHPVTNRSLYRAYPGSLR